MNHEPSNNRGIYFNGKSRSYNSIAGRDTGGREGGYFLMPAEAPMSESSVRYARFDKVMEAIRTAMADGFSAPVISDAELKARIKRAQLAAKG